MNYKFYNLDTLITSFFDNVRVINILHKNGIMNLYDLFICDINGVLNSGACGSKSKCIIEDVFYDLRTLANKRFDVSHIYNKYKYILNRSISISNFSDNLEFKNKVLFKRFLEIYEFENLSDRDFVNSNLIIRFLENYDGNSPLDYISPETSKFDCINDAYDYLNGIIKELSPVKLDMFRRYNGLNCEKETLDAIGKSYGLTRERVRQINKRTLKLIYNFFDSIFYKIKNTFCDNYYIPFDDSYLMIFCEYLYEKKVFNSEKIFDEKVYVKDNDLINTVAVIDAVVDKNGFYNEKIDDSILKLFGKKYLIIDGKIQKNNTLINYVPIVLEEIGRAVNLNSDNDVNLFYKKLEEDYNVLTEYRDSRNLERILCETSLLIDSRTYISEKYQKKADMSDIFKFINKSKVTNAQTIYSTFKDLWNSIDIYSHVGVYGYLKFFYPDKYNYAGRSFLINVIGMETSWGEIVINMIHEKGMPISFNIVNELYPALTNMIWINLESNFDDLIFWGDNSYYCNSLIKISDEDMSFITVYIYNNGLVSDKDLYTYILNNRDYIIRDNYIHSEKQLLKFIRSKFNSVINYNSDLKSYYI